MRDALTLLNVLLTGATGGVGTLLVKQLLQAGARVFATSRRDSALQDLKRLVPIDDHSRCYFSAADLSQPPCIPALVKEATDWFQGRIDVLINNAGVAYHCPVDSVIPEEAIEVMNVNALAPIILTTLALPALYKSPHPKVINISSFLGEKPLPLTATYTASKHALNGYSKVLRLETADRGVSVTLIEPGAIQTGFINKTHDPIAVERMGRRTLTKLSPDEVCRWVLAVIESPPFSCPEVIRVAPIGQAI